MPRPGRRVTPSSDLAAVVAAVEELQDLFGRISFGNPRSDATAGLPNGEPDNVWGSWVEGTFTANGTDVVFTHNLGIEPPERGRLNVRWLVTRVEGVLAGAFQVYYDGGAVTADSIALKAQGVPAAPHDNVPVTLFFVPAS